MVKKEEILGAATLLSILPVLSLGAIENLTMDLERAAKNLGPRHDENGLGHVAKAMRLVCQQAKNKEDRIDAELAIETR